ncbi:histone-fold-containing protein [Westerdykella ornata]|uniref:DNA polymerase epsilon subunit D n=1 Tax=Westerdykella ornata TaxID=318751 RepID=A0A6A6JIK6_WESOR|nr:histone-fold-containing protein [Westerdykella ornata]KAF2276262.1 histone-fold-containing protein [Westerdykella ornata]
MPPRKSNASVTAPEDAAKPAPKDDGLSVEDLNLPKSMVQRLAKGVLPPNTQIQKDALLAMSKSATVFVNYLTSQAAEVAAKNNKKVVQPADVFDAMEELELEFMLPRLKAEVTKFTAIQADKRNTYRKKVREEKRAQKGEGDGTGSKAGTNGNAAEDDSPPAKRVRMSSGGQTEQAEEEDEEVDVDEGADDVQDEEEDDEDEDEEDAEEEQVEEGLTEDLLEEREKNISDDEMADGDESD